MLNFELIFTLERLPEGLPHSKRFFLPCLSILAATWLLFWCGDTSFFRDLEAFAQIFATDIDNQAIEHARASIYPLSSVADTSPERLSLFPVAGSGDCFPRWIAGCDYVKEKIMVSSPGILGH